MEPLGVEILTDLTSLHFSSFPKFSIMTIYLLLEKAKKIFSYSEYKFVDITQIKMLHMEIIYIYEKRVGRENFKCIKILTWFSWLVGPRVIFSLVLFQTLPSFFINVTLSIILKNYV